MKPCRSGGTVVALSTLTLFARGHSTAATLEPALPTGLAGPWTANGALMQQAEQKPEHARPDLLVSSFRGGDDLQAGEELGFATLVKNDGKVLRSPFG